MERSKTKGGVSIEQNKVNGNVQSAEIVQRQEQSAGRMGVQPVRENLQTIPQDKRESVAIQLPVNIFDREAIRILYGQKDGASTVCLYLMPECVSKILDAHLRCLRPHFCVDFP